MKTFIKEDLDVLMWTAGGMYAGREQCSFQTDIISIATRWISQCIVSHFLQVLSHSDLFQTVASIRSFILAILLYPEVQTKGQSELDSVIGEGRLPTFSDRTSLPYVDCIVKEVLRWRPVAPLGFLMFDIADFRLITT